MPLPVIGVTGCARQSAHPPNLLPLATAQSCIQALDLSCVDVRRLSEVTAKSDPVMRRLFEGLAESAQDRIG